MINIIIDIIDCLKSAAEIFLSFSGILAVFVGYKYLSKRPKIKIVRFDPFASVEMNSFYKTLNTHNSQAIAKLENIFRDLQVPLPDKCNLPEGCRIIFPMDISENNFIKIWENNAKKYNLKRKALTNEEVDEIHLKMSMELIGYKNHSKSQFDKVSYFGSICTPIMFFCMLDIPAPKVYSDDKANNFENIFKNNHYLEDVFKKASEKIEPPELKSAFFESFLFSRELWTTFIVENNGNAIAKDIQIIFQPNSVSRSNKLINTTLAYQGIIYAEPKDNDIDNNCVENRLILIPFLKPGDIKIIVVYSKSYLPVQQILWLKSFNGEEINKNRILIYLIIFTIFAIGYLLILLLSKYLVIKLILIGIFNKILAINK